MIEPAPMLLVEAAGVVQRLQRRTHRDDRDLVTGEVVLAEQLAHFELDQFEELGVVHEVNLVEEHDDGRHADLAGKQDVLARLRHGAVGRPTRPGSHRPSARHP